MKFIRLRGANCYYDCAATLLDHSGCDHAMAFASAWTETDFFYDASSENFLSLRFCVNSGKIGVAVGKPVAAEDTKAKGFEDMPVGSLCIVGMDGFKIPWSPIFAIQHGPHCFLMEKGSGETQRCFDTVYGDGEKYLDKGYAISESYSITFAEKKEPSSAFAAGLKDSARERAEEVIETNGVRLRETLDKAEAWIFGSDGERPLAAKLTEAMTVSRYMYRHFLESMLPRPGLPELFYDFGYWKSWRHVKNGFYKAAIIGRDGAGFDDSFEESRRLLSELFDKEAEAARRLLSDGT